MSSDISNSPDELFKSIMLAANLAEKGESSEQNSQITSQALYSWNPLIKFADEHLLTANLQHHLEEINFLEELPSEKRLLLHTRSWFIERRIEDAIKQILEIHDLLTAASVEHCFLKGSAIILGEYEYVKNSRFMSDIDFLIHEKDLDIAFNTFIENGYETDMNVPQPLTEYWTSKHLPPLQKEGHTYRLECHQFAFEDTFLYRSPLTTSEIFSKSQLINKDGRNIRIPCAEHLYLSAFYHSQIFDLDQIAGRLNYRAMLDITGILKKEKRFDFDYINAQLNNLGAVSSHHFFTSTMAKHIGHPHSAKNVQEVQTTRWLAFNSAAKFPFAGRLTANFITFLRETKRAGSKAGSRQRKLIAKNNPDNWKYKPIIQQIINPIYLYRRFMYLIKRK